MGARGPKKKPRKPVIKFAPGVPAAPAWLDKPAVAEYGRVVDLLSAIPEHLQQVDLAVVASYAQAYADVCRLSPIIRREGEVLTNEVKGTSYLNPRLSALAQARNSMFEAMKRLGFSPADRSRAGTKPLSGSAINPLSEFISPPA